VNYNLSQESACHADSLILWVGDITRVCKVAYLFGYIFTCDDMYVNPECRSLSLVMLIEV